jgi:hypothetical protein
VYLFKTRYISGLCLNFGVLVTIWRQFDWRIVPICRISCLIWLISSDILSINGNTSSSHILVNICIRSTNKLGSSILFRIFSFVGQRRSWLEIAIPFTFKIKVFLNLPDWQLLSLELGRLLVFLSKVKI